MKDLPEGQNLSLPEAQGWSPEIFHFLAKFALFNDLVLADSNGAVGVERRHDRQQQARSAGLTNSRFAKL
jgi:hypothetical protein